MLHTEDGGKTWVRQDSCTDYTLSDITFTDAQKGWAVGEDSLVGIYLDPPKLLIDKKTIVIWLSGLQGEDIQVMFMERKTCRDLTANPGAFRMNEK